MSIPVQSEAAVTEPLKGSSGGPADVVMTDIPSILVQERFDLSEMLVGANCLANTYKIKADLDNWDSTDMPVDGWDKQWEDKTKAKKIFTAKEDSECMHKVCCKSFRTFDMTLHRKKKKKDPVGQYQFHRECKCSIPICGLFMCNPQEIDVKKNNVPIGKVVHDFEMNRCVAENFCMTRHWKVMNEKDEVEYYYKRNMCCNTNLCSPSCCCPVHKIEILDKDNQPTDGYLHALWPGCKKPKDIIGILTGNIRSTYHLKFPTQASDDQRANLMAGMFLIEYMVFEGQDEQGGGAGGV